MFHVANSPLTDRIYAGTVNKDGVSWKKKEDVTGAAYAAVAEHALSFGKPVIVSQGGKELYETTVRDLRNEAPTEETPNRYLITAEEYDKAIGLLEDAKTQLAPDGNCCAVCGDNDHQAFECLLNPLVQARRRVPKWRCFHCNEVFDDPEEARKHFGNIPSATPHCVLAKCRCNDCDCNPTECAGRSRWSTENA